MKIKSAAALVITMICALGPSTASAQIYKICDFHECCYVDSSGNGHCVPNFLDV